MPRAGSGLDVVAPSERLSRTHSSRLELMSYYRLVESSGEWRRLVRMQHGPGRGVHIHIQETGSLRGDRWRFNTVTQALRAALEQWSVEERGAQEREREREQGYGSSRGDSGGLARREARVGPLSWAGAPVFSVELAVQQPSPIDLGACAERLQEGRRVAEAVRQAPNREANKQSEEKPSKLR